MQEPLIPENETERLSALRELAVLDTAPEDRFDRITRVAKRHFNVPIALVSIVDAERQWFKSKQGLDACETPRGISFCGHAILADDIFYIPNALEDPRFADNPLVTGGPAIRFYAGAPLHAPNRQRIGTLCIIDDKPRQFSREELSVLRDLADGVEAELDRTHLYAAVEEVSRLAMVAEHTDNAVIITDAEGRVEWVNRGFERISGYSLADVAGNKPGGILQGPDTDPETVAFMRDKIRAGEAFSAEVLNYRKNGSPYWLELGIQPIHGRDGRVERYIAIESDVTTRKRSEQQIREQNLLLDAISRAQSRFIQNADLAQTFDGILGDLLAVTASEYGFIGEVLKRANGTPYLRTYAITNIAWNEETRRFYDEHAPKGMEFSNLDTLFGAVMKTGEVVIANAPANDARRGGLPPGHPPLNAFLGLPIYQGDRLVGMAGLANRPGGYDPALIAYLSPLTKTLGTLIDAVHSDKELKSGEARIRAILDTVLDGIISIDAHGMMQTVNPAAERLFGYTKADMLGRNVNMLMPEPYHTAHDGYLHNYLSTGNKKIIGIGREVVGRRQDGSVFPMELAVSEMEVDGKRMFTGIVRDITERKRLDRLKSEFVSTVSHELRTPLTSIRGALSLVLGKFTEQLPDKARKMLEMADRNSERLTVLINDILDLEKIESGRLDFEFALLDMVGLATRALEDNEGYARKHQVRLRLQTDLGQAPVRGDAHRLLQVFANLISNAVKYSPPDGEVEISVSTRDGGFRVGVRDHGSGIPEEFRSRIFQRFAQADSSDTRDKGGTGLGLSITKAIIERHDGSIGYESEEGRGTEFYFDLPVAPEATQESLGGGEGVRVLICEDNADVAAILAEMLEPEGVVSDIAHTAEAARALLAKHAYRLLLLDLTLPDADGLDFLRELRAVEATADLPVIVVSGRAEEGRKAFSGDAVAVVDWLQKPLDRVRMERALREAMRRHARPSILHVEDDADIVQITHAVLEDMAELSHVATLHGARELLSAKRFDLVLLDLGLTDGSGLDLLDELKGHCPVVIFSAQMPGREITEQVTAALTKSMTSNEQLLDTIKKILRG